MLMDLTNCFQNSNYYVNFPYFCLIRDLRTEISAVVLNPLVTAIIFKIQFCPSVEQFIELDGNINILKYGSWT